MNLRKLALLVAISGTSTLLAACGGGGGKLLGKSLPDETQVVDGPSLALPPQFELRPPREAQDYEAALRAQKSVETQNLITTGTSESTVTGSKGADAPADTWLLDKTSAGSGVAPNPNIRTELMTPPDETEKKKEKAKQGLFQRWFGSSEDDE